MSKIPEGFNTLTPSLIVNDAAKAIELYKKAFGATEDYRMENPADKSKIMHACLNIGNSKIFLADIDPKMCPTASASGFYVYLDDVDSAFKQACQAGMKEMNPPTDMFWGDRCGGVKDSFGITWSLATHVRDVSDKEMEEGKKQWEQKIKAA